MNSPSIDQRPIPKKAIEGLSLGSLADAFDPDEWTSMANYEFEGTLNKIDVHLGDDAISD